LLSLSLSLSHTNTHTLHCAISLSHTHTHTHTLSLSLSLSLLHTHTQNSKLGQYLSHLSSNYPTLLISKPTLLLSSDIHSLPHTNTQTHTHTHTHSSKPGHYLTLLVDPPLRKGQTHYAFVVLFFESDPDDEPETVLRIYDSEFVIQNLRRILQSQFLTFCPLGFFLSLDSSMIFDFFFWNFRTSKRPKKFQLGANRIFRFARSRNFQTSCARGGKNEDRILKDEMGVFFWKKENAHFRVFFCALSRACSGHWICGEPFLLIFFPQKSNFCFLFSLAYPWDCGKSPPPPH